MARHLVCAKRPDACAGAEFHAGRVDGVDVVAVRTGRSVADRNRFPDGARAAVTQALARGDDARLELQDGAESYAVTPSLSWGRTEDGVPTVTDVTIDSVHFE